jgi:hypothetical protein
MPCELLSQVCSTNTFVEGLDIPLTSTEGVLTQELQKLEEMVLGKMDVCFQHGMFNWWTGLGSTNVICSHESQRVFNILSCFALISKYGSKNARVCNFH